MTIMVVVYDLPNRDCSSEASNGELRVEEDGLNRYKTEYIDDKDRVKDLLQKQFCVCDLFGDFYKAVFIGLEGIDQVQVDFVVSDCFHETDGSICFRLYKHLDV